MIRNKNILKLELGDWVQGCHEYVNGSRRLAPPMYVVGIWESGVYLEIDPEQGDPFEYDYKDIIPIDLTDDIFKVNGIWDNHPDWSAIEKVGYHISVMDKTDGSYDVAIITNDGRDDSVSCRFVHELQHFINLCGIDKQIKLR